MRVGAVLLALSLALYLITLIPHGIVWTDPGIQLILPETFTLTFTSYPDLLNFQTGMQVTAESNGTLSFLVFDLPYPYVKGWFDNRTVMHNWTLSVLQEFTAAHQNNIMENLTFPAGKIEFQYVPAKMENVTITTANPTSLPVMWTYNFQEINVVASPQRVSFALMITAPLGVVLAIPWIITTITERRKTPKNPPSA